MFSVRKQKEIAVQEHAWGSIAWLAPAPGDTVAGLTLGRVVIRAGQSNPRHGHQTCSEVLYLEQGRLRHTAGERDVIMEAGDVLTVAPGVFHNAFSLGPQDAVMIVAYPTPQRDFVPEGKAQ